MPESYMLDMLGNYTPAAIFLIFLWMIAWEDFKTGYVNVYLLGDCFVITGTVIIVTASFNRTWHIALWEAIVAAAANIVLWEVIVGIAVLAVLMLLTVCNKMGGADTVIFSQIFLFFGLPRFISILFATSITACLWLAVRHMTGKKIEKNQQIPMIPFIALSSQLIFTWGLLKA